jgi:16S rRNA (guanine966-N2)-methyltransferase
MRVIAGRFRSRVLLAPSGLDTRPTADRMRETLFNVLTQGAVDRVQGARFLDLYAGSGAVGIEALSRDAASVTFVEQSPAALGILAKNLTSLGLRAGENLRVEKRGVGRFLRGALADFEGEKVGAGGFGVVFLDPPYDAVEEYALALGLLGGECASLLEEGAVVAAEHRKKVSLEASYGKLVRGRVLAQGDAGLSFYAMA